MGKIDLSTVAENYNSIETIWDKNDKWHSWTHRMIKKFIKRTLKKTSKLENLKILNAGSGGYCYDLYGNNITHIDIAKNKISSLDNSILANVENIPFLSNQFDLIICVGSVINYCDPIKVIEEFFRVLKKGGNLILEFEDSKTTELLGLIDFNRKVVLRKTFYNKKEEILWYFSSNFIKEIIKVNNLELLIVFKFHLFSPFIYRVTKSETFAASFSVLDLFIRYIPFINKLSSNTIYLIRK